MAGSDAPRIGPPAQAGAPRAPLRPLRICQFSSAASSVYHLLRGQILALQTRGHHVRALSGSITGQLWEGKPDVVEFPHDSGPVVRELAPVRDALALAWLVSYFRRNRFDVVHTHTPKAGLLGPLAARMAGVPLVVHTVHGFLFHDQTALLERCAGWLAEKWTASCVDLLLFQSREDYENAQRLRILRRERCVYVGNGVQADRYRNICSAEEVAARRLRLGLRPDDFVVGYVGRLVREKGILDLLRAFEEFSQFHAHARLLIIGAPEVASQKDSLKEADLNSWSRRIRVTFAGYRPNVEELYPVMDAFVLPSYREGLPRALVEACIAGVPVIATNIRGNREVVQDGITGLLYAAGDTGALVRCLDSVFRDRSAARGRAAAAQSTALARFDEELVFDRVEQAYAAHFPDSTDKRPFFVRRPNRSDLVHHEPFDV